MVTVVPACFGLFIFCMANTHGRVGGGLPQSAATSASSFSWFIMYAINAGLGNTANIITNQPDFSRWSKYKYASIWAQIIANPISVTLSATLGILSTSAINNAWGLELWNPWDLLDAIMTRYPRSDVRFAIFICASFWALLILGTNVAANMIPFGSDSTMLLPRYINIPRGQFLGLVLAWAVCPWKILYSAQTFTNFLGGYIIFMASAVGIMVADYFVITKGNNFLRHLYDGNSDNPHYYYFKGWNIQAYIAYIAGVIIPFPGFCGSLGANVSETAMNIGHIGWLLSFVVSMVVYIALCYVWPTSNMKAMRGMNLRFEEMAEEEFDPTVLPNYAHDQSPILHGTEVVAVDDVEHKGSDIVVQEGSEEKEIRG
jgi:NCS1 family nucleobase:cation symporter-1